MIDETDEEKKKTTGPVEDVRKAHEGAGSLRDDCIVVSIWMRIDMGWRRIAPNMGCFRNASDFSVAKDLVGPRKCIPVKT